MSTPLASLHCAPNALKRPPSPVTPSSAKRIRDNDHLRVDPCFTWPLTPPYLETTESPLHSPLSKKSRVGAGERTISTIDLLGPQPEFRSTIPDASKDDNHTSRSVEWWPPLEDYIYKLENEPDTLAGPVITVDTVDSPVPFITDDDNTGLEPQPCDLVEDFDLELSLSEVCFGMVTRIPMTLGSNPPLPIQLPMIYVLDDLKLDGASIFSGTNMTQLVGFVKDADSRVLSQLVEQPGIYVQLRCIVTQTEVEQGKHRGAGKTHELCASLDAIVYGPLCAFTSIGDFLEESGACLQDPRGCGRNVPYRNPHRLSGLDEDAPMTCDRTPDESKGRAENPPISASLLDGLYPVMNLGMADTPDPLKTQLFSHQREALFFMLARERGWSFDGGLEDDIWRSTTMAGLPLYHNSINDDTQMEPPPSFRGGLLADDMGLGKTLEMISLIASDKTLDKPHASVSLLASIYGTCNSIKCTLVVVPATLLDTWETQLETHIKPEALRWARHHKKTRFTQVSQVHGVDLILTTYNTISMEWRKRHHTSSILYTVRWHRIILDEAHVIRDDQTQMAEAICDLDAERRWVVTGTPIQNHVTDLVTLLKFLRAHPFDNRAAFDRDIVDLWKHDSHAAIDRLKRLIGCLGLRRTSNTISLPERTDLSFRLEFSPHELEIYASIEQHIKLLLDQECSDRLESQATHLHVLQGLGLLRSICNHGSCSDISKFTLDQATSLAWGPLQAQALFDGIMATGDVRCVRCASDIVQTGFEDSSYQAAFGLADYEPMVSQCAQVLCGNCANGLRSQGEWNLELCEHKPLCTVHPALVSQRNSAQYSSEGESSVDLNDCPTKIKALIADIGRYPESKCVVFSAWRTTLDMAAGALEKSGTKFVRFDGKVADKNRGSVLSLFAGDPTTRVMLITISCGAVGLDLTAADRAYIMEPQWNPTVEDQALARVYRMGQKRPVTTIRFEMKNSIEQRILKVQGRKKDFADLLLSKKKSFMNAERDGFAKLRSLLQ